MFLQNFSFRRSDFMFTTIPILFFSLIAVYFFFRHFKRFTLFFFILTPILLTPLWISYDFFGWFRWVKVYSLVAGVFFIFLARLPRFSQSKLIFNLVYLILGINILEAILKEASTFDLPSAINIFTGVLLILSLIDPNHNIYISSTKERDFITPKLTFQWILVYSLWNWSFLYSVFPNFAFKHIAVLGAPLFIDFIMKGSWLQARALTLCFYVIFSFTTNPYLGSYFPTAKYNQNIALMITVFNLSFWIYYRFILLSQTQIDHEDNNKLLKIKGPIFQMISTFFKDK